MYTRIALALLFAAAASPAHSGNSTQGKRTVEVAQAACGNIAEGQECAKDFNAGTGKVYQCRGGTLHMTPKICSPAGTPCNAYPNCNQ